MTMFLDKIVPRRWCHFSVIWQKGFKNIWYQELYFFIGRTPMFNQVRSDIIVSVGKLLIFLGYLFSVAGESQSCHKGQCWRRRVISCWQRAEHQIQDSQVNFYTPVQMKAPPLFTPFSLCVLVSSLSWKFDVKIIESKIGGESK